MKFTTRKVQAVDVKERVRQNCELRPFLATLGTVLFCLRSCKSHLQGNEKFMSTMGKFSRTDSLLFKDKSFLYPRPNGSRDANPTVLKGMNTEA